MAEEIIGLKVELDTSGASAPMASLKSQIKEATNELVNFTGKFGATSKEAINAAKRVAELKDRMGDAKQMVDAFNPDAKFNALTQSISGAVAGFSAVQGAMGLLGVESESTQKALLKVQSAMALSQGLSTFLDSGLEGFRNLGRQIAGPLIDSFKSFSAAARTAIATTGIGLLVIAIGLIAANWDKIKTAMNGVSEEQKKLNALAQKNVEAEENKLKKIKDSENIYKLQGKSEREILKMKQDQVRATIDEKEKKLEGLIITNKASLDAATNNKRILTSVLDIVQKPLTLLLDGIDLIGKAFGKNFNLKGQLLSFEANLLFDPEQVKKDSDAAVKNLEQELLNLKNERAGYELSIKDIDKKSADDAEKKQKDAQEKRKQLAKDAYNKQLEDLKLSLNEENKTFAERRKLVLENTKLTAEDRKKLNKEIDDDEKKYNEEHQKKLAEINKKYDAERLDREADTAVKKEELDYQRRLTEINSLVATTTEKNILIEKLNAEHLVRMEAAKKTDDEKALELSKKYDTEKANREADTYVKKEELDYQRRLAEINSLATSETQKFALIEKLDAEHKARLIEATKKDAATASALRQAAINADIDTYMQAATSINSILSKSNANQLADLEANSQARIAAAGGNKEAILAIENETAIEKNRLQNEQVKREKLFAIAEAIINTYKAAAQVFARPAPGDPVTSLGIKIASMVAAVASGIANVMAIRKVPLPSGGGGGGDVSGGSAPNSPMGTVFNTITKLNKDSIDKINDKAVKAYVVETDINNGQKRIERILINTKFK
jgi:hypothetical protein